MVLTVTFLNFVVSFLTYRDFKYETDRGNITWSHWAEHQPNEDQRKKCVGVNLMLDDRSWLWRWFDLDCSEELAVVCQEDQDLKPTKGATEMENHICFARRNDQLFQLMFFI